MPSPLRAAPLLLLASLSACSSLDAPPGADGEARQCRAEAVPGLIGKLASGERVEAALEQTGAARVRLLAPGDRATQEVDAQRLNIEIDEAEQILRIYCG